MQKANPVVAPAKVPSVPDHIMALIREYGDQRADDNPASPQTMGKVITAIRQHYGVTAATNAERYRFLRSAPWFKHGFAKTEANASAFHFSGDVLDQMVDAARGGATVVATAVDTSVGQPFAIVHGYVMGSKEPSLACFTGGEYEFSDGDQYRRVGDTLAGLQAEFLTLHQLEQRLSVGWT